MTSISTLHDVLTDCRKSKYTHVNSLLSVSSTKKGVWHVSCHKHSKLCALYPTFSLMSQLLTALQFFSLKMVTTHATTEALVCAAVEDSVLRLCVICTQWMFGTQTVWKRPELPRQACVILKATQTCTASKLPEYVLHCSIWHRLIDWLWWRRTILRDIITVNFGFAPHGCERFVCVCKVTASCKSSRDPHAFLWMLLYGTRVCLCDLVMRHVRWACNNK